MPAPPAPGGGRGGGGRGSGANDFGGRGAGRGGGRDGGGGRGGAGGGYDRGHKTQTPSEPAKEKPKKEKAIRAKKLYVGEIKGTGEVVGKVTQPMGPSGDREKDSKGRDDKKSNFPAQYDADSAAAAHPAWAAKRKAANEAWGSVKAAGKKTKFE